MILGAFTGMKTLSVFSDGIAYAIFGARSPSFGSSTVYADNFRFTAVPEPGAIAMWGLASFGFVFAARRKKAAAVCEIRIVRRIIAAGYLLWVTRFHLYQSLFMSDSQTHRSSTSPRRHRICDFKLI